MNVEAFIIQIVIIHSQIVITTFFSRQSYNFLMKKTSEKSSV